MYTIFCILNYFDENNLSITEQVKLRFNDFIDKYNKFENSSDTDNESKPEEEMIKKYKLASSEGVNKIKNRKLRFEILRNYIIN